MGLFFKRKDKGNDEIVVYAPFAGKIKPIESLADKTFADKVMGDGIAIIPNEGEVHSPIDGHIESLLETKHAYGMANDAGMEILIHIGQDTVQLNGKHFECNVKEEQKIKQGELLGTFDLEAIKKDGYNVATPVILIDGDFSIVEKTTATEVKTGDMLFKVKKN